MEKIIQITATYNGGIIALTDEGRIFTTEYKWSGWWGLDKYPNF